MTSPDSEIPERPGINPYEAPDSDPPRNRKRPGRRPPVFLFYAIYCWAAAGFAGLLAVSAAAQIVADDAGPDALASGLVAAAFVALSVAFAAGPLLPRRPWAWTYGLVLILLGFALSWLFIALWLSPATKRYYLEPGS